MGLGWFQMALFIHLVVGASSARPPPAPAFLLLDSRGHDTASMFSISAVPTRASSCNAEDARDEGSILGWGRSPAEELGNPLQYSCLENPMDRGAWWARVHGVAKGWTQLKQLSMHD